ncbi:MAG TPA: helix-turn-helix transcriptional regulator [Thermoanaerobaculia bacterium]|nr:helix-turn-helix transcriptional regulator [Thermoanaerobaculia bacterium]
MSRNDPPPLFAAVLRHLRQNVRGWTQRRLEREAGLPVSRVSKLERGTYALDRPTLENLVAALGLPAASIGRTIAALEQAPGARGASQGLEILTPLEGQRVEELASELARTAASIARRAMSAELVRRRVRREREEAGRLWAHLRRQQPAELQRDLVSAVERYQTWAMSERLCAESVLAAADDAERALHLAGLALLAAERSPGKEEHRLRREGYAWGFLGNARRVAGDLPEAEKGFLRAEELWDAGEASPAEPLDGSRLLDLKASLHRYQGRYEESVELLEHALEDAGSGEAISRLLLKRAATLEYLERYGDALASLAQAEPWIEAFGPARLRCVLRFNRIVNLCHLRQFETADQELAILRGLSIDLRHDLDRLRVRWLEARVAEGFGRRDDAAEGLREVWQAFARKKIIFDAGLAVLELAALELERGRTREVKALASDAASIFAAQMIPRELLASVQLFWQAAQREAATSLAARRLLTELRRIPRETFL